MVSMKPYGWSFGGGNAILFKEHVEKSVPGYVQSHQLAISLAKRFARPGSGILDIGSSRGDLAYAIATETEHLAPPPKVFGIDAESAMIELATAEYGNQQNLEFVEGDFLDIEIETEAVSFVSSLYTFQFIPMSTRQAAYDKVSSYLDLDGAFLIFEKIHASNAWFQDILAGEYFDWKDSKGHSADEMLQKERSLRGILKPASHEANLQMLRKAGFSNTEVVFRYLNFEGILAIK